MPKRVNKYLYLWKLYVCYNGKWEYEIAEDTFKEIRARAKEYRENCPQYPVRYGRGRELNPEYERAGI